MTRADVVLNAQLSMNLTMLSSVFVFSLPVYWSHWKGCAASPEAARPVLMCSTSWGMVTSPGYWDGGEYQLVVDDDDCLLMVDWSFQIHHVNGKKRVKI